MEKNIYSYLDLKKLIYKRMQNFFDYENVKCFFISKPFNFKDFAKNVINNNLNQNHFYPFENDFNIFCPIQTHGKDVIILKDYHNYHTNNQIYGDAVITNLKNQCICITTADCLPILLYENKQNVIAIIHAGWRGLYSEIITFTLQKMKDIFNCETFNIKCIIGPSICVDHYEIGNDLLDKLKNKFNFCEKIIKFQNNKYYLDLKKLAFLQLIDHGILGKNVNIFPVCTYEDDEYYSFRKEGINAGRFLSGIILF